MALRLRTSIGIAIAAHAALLLLQPGNQKPRQTSEKTDTPLALDLSLTPHAPHEKRPFTVELVPWPQSTESPAQETPAKETPAKETPATKTPPSIAAKSSEAPTAESASTQGPKAPGTPEPKAPGTPEPKAPGTQGVATAERAIRKTTEPGPPGTSFLGPEKTPTEDGQSGGFSMRMRQGGAPKLDGRQGSLLDDAIASSLVPGGGGQVRSDIIQAGPRIGHGTASGPDTQWRDSGGGTKTSVGEAFTARIARDGRISFADRPAVEAEIVDLGGIPLPMIAGKFDLTDAAMAAFGQVLYPYRKLKAMDQTRDQRAAMAVRAQGEDLHAALRHFNRKLKKLWRNTSLSAEKRRAIIFALWDECAEQGPADVVKTAAAIRAIIVSFVARQLPETSAEAYSSRELSSLNAARQSKRKFAPYE